MLSYFYCSLAIGTNIFRPTFGLVVVAVERADGHQNMSHPLGTINILFFILKLTI